MNLRAKKELYSTQVSSFDGTEQIANLFISLKMEGMDILEITDTIANITFDEVKACFDSQYKAERMALSVILPKNGGEQ